MRKQTGIVIMSPYLPRSPDGGCGAAAMAAAEETTRSLVVHANGPRAKKKPGPDGQKGQAFGELCLSFHKQRRPRQQKGFRIGSSRILARFITPVPFR